MNPILEIDNLSVSYLGRALLLQVNLTIQKGSLTAVLGPSGVGKSTLLRAINRLVDEEVGFSRTGSILFQGCNIDEKMDKSLLRRRIGIILQKPVIFPISIFKNVIFGIHHLGLRAKREFPGIVEELLKVVGLWEEVKDRLHTSALELSAGQQQRLTMARTLALQPEILLADEITSSLDKESSRKIEELLLQLKKNHSLVVVTHQVEQALRIADNILCLKAVNGVGQTEFFGTPGEYRREFQAHA